MEKEEKLGVLEDFRPVLLVSPDKDKDLYGYLSKEWIPLTDSAYIYERSRGVLKTGADGLGYYPDDNKFGQGFLADYKYNKKGEVRHGDKMMKLQNGRRFIAAGFHVYMPKPEVIVSNGERSFRFDTMKEASEAIHQDVSMLLGSDDPAYKRKGWSAQYGWPMPFILKKRTGSVRESPKGKFLSKGKSFRQRKQEFPRWELSDEEYLEQWFAKKEKR
jgi:hypothetical protein